MLEDPKRTASPYCAPGEREPAPIDLDAATGIIIDAIERQHWAYGWSSEALKDWMIDAIIESPEAFVVALKACRDQPSIVDSVERIVNSSDVPV